jgi:hypothetical protein
MARLPASGLPSPLSFGDAADIVARRSVAECDLKAGATGLWILDVEAKLGPVPEARQGFIMGAAKGINGIGTVQHYRFNIGRNPERSDVTLPYEYVSNDHVAVTFYEDIVHIENRSRTNGIFVGGGWIGPEESIRVQPDVPFVFGVSKPDSKTDGTVLVCPMDMRLADSLQTTHRMGVLNTLDRFVLVKRDPWKGPASIEKSIFRGPPRQKGVPIQASDITQKVITPPQILDADKYIRLYCDELKGETDHIREFIRDWIERGNLDKHVKGHHRWDERLLNNVRQGGMLLATHSTDVKGAVAIINDLQIDPKYSRKRKAYFRYGLGHSYGEIVFVQRPGISGLGKVNDIWNVMIKGDDTLSELYRLAKKVDYNRNVKVRPGQPAAHDPKGRSAMVEFFDDSALMELFPQFESTEPVSIINSYIILAPEHLYDEFVEQIPKQFRDWVVCIPGTGKTREDFLRGVKDVARRSRMDGGSFQPKIGRDALLRYELMYFKIVETVLRFRHRALRKKIEEFAEAVAKSELGHPEIINQIADTTALLPESFRVLHLMKQFPSHDGHSPLGHTMNAVIEAAYMAPRLAEEFTPLFIKEAFIALWLHDLGKISDAKADDHGKLSVEMAKYHLKMMDFTGDPATVTQIQKDMILHFIENAGLISEASQALDKGEHIDSVASRIVPRMYTRPVELFLMNFADTASIPGRSGRRMLVNTDYTGVVDVRAQLIATFRELLKRKEK